MKRILRKILFLDAPAQGAFFALTALLSLPWLLFTLFTWRFIGGDFISTHIFATIFLHLGFLLFVQFYTMRGVALNRFVPKNASFWRRHFDLMFFLGLLAAFVLFHHLEIYDAIMPLFGVYLFTGLAFVPGGRKREWGAMALLWFVGFTGFYMMFAYTCLPFMIVIDMLYDGLGPIVQYHTYPMLTTLYEGLRLSGIGWSAVACLSFLCVLLAYLLHGKVLAHTAGLPVRRLFCKRTLCLLGICAAIYAVCLPLALLEECRYCRTVRQLEEHFGQPLSVAQLKKLYLNEGQEDADFWNELRQVAFVRAKEWYWKSGISPKPTNDSYSPFGRTMFWSEWEEAPYRKWRTFCVEQPENGRLNALLEGPIPLAPRTYEERRLLYRPWPFGDVETLRNSAYLQLWQLHFALDDRDEVAARCVFQRLENISNFLKRNDFATFYFVESLRLTAFLRVIESGLADEAWLDREQTRLERLETELAAAEKREIYRQAVLFESIVDTVAHRLDEAETLPDGSQRRIGADLSCLRFFFPQAWRRAARAAQINARQYLNDTFAEMDIADDSFLPFSWLVDEAERASRCADGMRVLIRGGKMLLEAEKIRRRTGSYPLQMNEMPLDPFTGRPLRYSVGPCEIMTAVVKWAPPDFCGGEEAHEDDACACGCDCVDGCPCAVEEDLMCVEAAHEQRTFHAVQIFSPGAEEDRMYDDIRYFIRCPLSP